MTHRNAEARLPQTFIAKPDADARALRAFWRGVFTGAVGMAVLGSLAAVLG